MSTEDALRRCAEANQRHQERIAQLERHARDEHAMGQAFVDRINELERENTELREIARAVAKIETRNERSWSTYTCPLCEHQGENDEHYDGCLITKARKLLGTDAKI